MIKIIFVLVINAYHGGVATIDFTTLQQCETARNKIAKETKSGASLGMTCIEKQVPLKKTNCKIVHNHDYRNHNKGGYPSAQNMDGYPYPVALECVEQ